MKTSIVVTVLLIILCSINVEAETTSWNEQGTKEYVSGHRKAAIEAWNKVPTDHPDYPIACLNKGIALAELGQSEKAIAAFNQVSENSPEYCKACRNKGITLQKQGRFEEALIAFNQIPNVTS